MDLGETVSARQSHSSVSLILASLFVLSLCVTLLLSFAFKFRSKCGAICSTV